MARKDRLLSDIEKHLIEDIRNYVKEIQEDKQLIKKITEKGGNAMKKQTRKDRMDESLGMRRGKESTKKQSYKDRRDESMGMKKAMRKKKK